jgi:hypothetical protein
LLQSLPDSRGTGEKPKEQIKMQKLVDKHIAEAPEANDEGVVGIEYVVVAGLVAAGLAIVFATTGIFQTMLTDLNNALK